MVRLVLMGTGLATLGLGWLGLGIGLPWLGLERLGLEEPGSDRPGLEGQVPTMCWWGYLLVGLVLMGLVLTRPRLVGLGLEGTVLEWLFAGGARVGWEVC